MTATDVPLTHLIIRASDLNVPRGAPRPKPQAVIDHICYTIADFNQERVCAELTALGATNVRKGGMNSVYANDPIGYEIQINGLASAAVGGGS